MNASLRIVEGGQDRFIAVYLVHIGRLAQSPSLLGHSQSCYKEGGGSNTSAPGVPLHPGPEPHLQTDSAKLPLTVVSEVVVQRIEIHSCCCRPQQLRLADMGTGLQNKEMETIAACVQQE
jgi:hypothetical protein